MTLETTCRHLESLQRDLDLPAGPALSLAPDRPHATPLPKLLRHLLPAADDPTLIPTFARTLEAIARARAAHFPDNIFGDLDYLAASLLRGARHHADGPHAYLTENTRRIVALQTLFGVRSRIRFRYVHDFIYGYDWSRWVRRDPASRRHIGPFDPAFLAYLHQRGQQLLQRIDRNDSSYPTVPPGQNRNPFPFSRQPAAERRLHLSLADDGLIPLAAWDIDAQPRWDREYSQLRQQRADALASAQNINRPHQPATSSPEENEPC